MSEEQRESTRPPLVCDQVMGEINVNAQNILDEFGEPEMIITLVVWDVGQNDFPFGTIVKRKETPADWKRGVRCLDQLRKMIGHVSQHYLEGHYEKVVGDLTQHVQKQEEEIQQLRAQLAEKHEGGEGEPTSS